MVESIKKKKEMEEKKKEAKKKKKVEMKQMYFRCKIQVYAVTKFVMLHSWKNAPSVKM